MTYIMCYIITTHILLLVNKSTVVERAIMTPQPLCCHAVCVQLYGKGGKKNEESARARLIDIVEGAGDEGFKTLVRALARNEQERLAIQLDEDLAKSFIKKPSALASMLSFSFCIFSLYHPICW